MPVSQQDDIIRYTAKQSQVGKAVLNVYHAKLVGTGEVDDTLVRTGGVNKISAAHLEINSEQGEDLLYTTIEVWNITEDRPIGESVWAGITAGTGLSGFLPPAVAGLVLFNTLVARSQGRKYIGGMVENANNEDGQPDNVTVLALLAYTGLMLNFGGLGTGELQWGNYRKLPLRFAPWDSAEVSLAWGTQRRRYVAAGS